MYRYICATKCNSILPPQWQVGLLHILCTSVTEVWRCSSENEVLMSEVISHSLLVLLKNLNLSWKWSPFFIQKKVKWNWTWQILSKSICNIRSRIVYQILGGDSKRKCCKAWILPLLWVAPYSHLSGTSLLRWSFNWAEDSIPSLSCFDLITTVPRFAEWKGVIWGS